MTNKGLSVAGEHGAATTEARYGRDFLLAKIAEKGGLKFSQKEDDYSVFDNEEKYTPPKQPSMREILGPGGIISKSLPGYEVREAQLQMAELVAEAIEKKEHVLVEAGTGVGKSLAYLIPAIYSGKTTIVSTGDKGLQMQLWNKDIPFLASVLPIPVRAAILKGKSNYVCVEKYDEEAMKQAMLGESVEWSSARFWLSSSDTGDVEELGITLSSELQQNITTTADACLGKSCPNIDKCYVEHAKALASRADIVIVNHTLLALDMSLRASTDGAASALPDRDLIIIDEAHRLEDAATLAFTIEVSPIGISRLLNDKIVKIDKSKITTIEASSETLFTALSKLNQSQSYALGAPPYLIQELTKKLAIQLNGFASDLKRSNPYTDEKDIARYKKHIERVTDYAWNVESILNEDDDYVIFVEKRIGHKGKNLIYLKRCPISLADSLSESLFGVWPTICTSATIATGKSFEYFKSRSGCDDARELVVDSPFDYKKNALIYLPMDGKAFDPTRYYQDDSPEYFDRMATTIEKLLLASDGRAFCLFTSNKALNEVYERIAHRLQWLVLRQGDMPRPEMIKRFRENGSAVLFGLRSFWEGIDVQGEALSLVIIDKIPFGQPEDPIYQARSDKLVKETGDKWAWFSKLALPNAMITYKQGFGRLIRTKSDRGVVALLDGRISTKGYGTSIIKSLPPATTTRSIEAIKTFFSTGGR